MKPIFLFILIFFSPIIHGANYNLYTEVHGLSRHFGTSKNLNELNKGIGIRLQRDIWSVLIGFYANSLSKTKYSKYISLRKDVLKLSSSTFGIEAGLVKGYLPQAIPAAIFILGKRVNNFSSLNFRYLPPVKNITPSVLGVSFEMRIN